MAKRRNQRKPTVPMMRLPDEIYEKLEEMAVAETQKQGKIVPVKDLLKMLVDTEYQRFRETSQTTVKPSQRKGKDPAE